MSEIEARDADTRVDTPQPMDKVVWATAAICVVLAVCGTWAHFYSRPDAAVMTSSPAAGGAAVGGSGPTSVRARPGTQIWNPISLPRDSKATFTTTFREPGFVDYQFFLAGESGTIRKLFESHPSITLSLLDRSGKMIEQHTVDPNKLLLNGDGFISHEASFAMNAQQYNSIADWDVEVRFDRAALGGVTVPAPVATAAPLTPRVQPRRQSSSSAAPNAVRNSSSTGATLIHRLETLERLLLGSPASAEALDQRLDRLENQIFSHNSPYDTPEERIRTLEISVYGSSRSSK